MSAADSLAHWAALLKSFENAVTGNTGKVLKSGPTQPYRTYVEALEPRVLLTGAPMEDRGWVSLIVEQAIAASISTNLGVLAQDQLGDGYTHVSTHTDAPTMDDENYVWNNQFGFPVTVASDSGLGFLDQYKSDLAAVKAMIAADAAAAIAAGSHLESVVIIGHVTVPYSGNDFPYDVGHGARAFPTDRYYADLDASPETPGETITQTSRMAATRSTS
jgi:hypothetical protein